MVSGAQPALALAAIGLSVFSLITYLWLGVTTLLVSERRSLVTWVAGAGLLLGALFFLCHGALVAAGAEGPQSPQTGLTDLWWRLTWAPAFFAPLAWAAVGLRYTALSGAWQRLRVPALAAVAALGAVTALLALLSWPSIAHYSDFLALLNRSLRAQGEGRMALSPWLPALGVAFVVYVATCVALPWAALAVRRFASGFALSLPAPLATQRDTRRPWLRATLSRLGRAVVSRESLRAPVDAPTGESLWSPADAWDRARPALLAASLCMLVAGGVVAVVGLALALFEHRVAASVVSQTLPAVTAAPAPGHAALALVLADLCVQVALAGFGVMVGWAVVRQGVLVERQLPQRGYFSHWRAMAGLAGALAAVVAWMGALQPEALLDLLLLAALVAVATALLTWQSYMTHDRLLRQLRPFMASLSLGQTGWLATNPDEVEHGVDALFASLCRDVLGVTHGRLTISAGRLRHTFVYTVPDDEASATDGAALTGRALWRRLLGSRAAAAGARAWTLPVTDGRGAQAVMVLGPRLDGVSYTATDLEIARACGQRILDAMGEFATAQAVATLARRRGLEAELTAALPRRVLHDDVLPRLHLAMLRLEALRARLPHPVAAGVAPRAGTAPASSPAPSIAGEAPTLSEADEIGAVVAELGRAHRDLAALMRAAPMASARRLEHGFTGALRGALDGEFRGVFDTVEWVIPPEAEAAADALPPIVADLLLSAALEAVRNAGRHARGADLHRTLRLRLRLRADPQTVTVEVNDNGVGLEPSASAPESAGAATHESAGGPVSNSSAHVTGPAIGPAGARSGLLTHSALMTLAGGALNVQSSPEGGVMVTIRAPRASDLGEGASSSSGARA